MERIYDHTELGRIKPLLTYQRSENDLVKMVTLVSSSTYRIRTDRIRMAYYLMWGNNHNLNENGYVRILTKSSRNPTFKSALKFFNQAKLATEFINFKY